MSTKTIQKAEEAYTETFEYRDQPPSDIVTYNELRSCADLNRLYTTGQLEIQPDFQRDVVWSDPDQTRFIDSLVKQLPIPSMCFSYDFTNRSWKVIDGLQRMSSIVRLLGNDKWRLSRLDDIDPRLSGIDAALLRDKDSELRELYDRVENIALPITILRCDYSKESHMEYLFTIFHRLNAGGARLNNQEIRNCIYSGTFNNLLRKLNSDPLWPSILSHINGKKDRFRSVELILRFFAFYTDRASYKSNLPRFLNLFMLKNRSIDDASINESRDLFRSTAQFVVEKLLPLLDGRKLGFSQAEALLVGVASNIETLPQVKPADLSLKLSNFFALDSLSSSALASDISRKELVLKRLQDAIGVFS